MERIGSGVFEQFQADDAGGIPAGAELLQLSRVVAASRDDDRLHDAGILSADSAHSGGWQVPSRLLRRSPGDAGSLRSRPCGIRPQRCPRREDGPGADPDGDGPGDPASRTRHDLLDDLLRAVPCGPYLRDDGPAARRQDRVERRHLAERLRGGEFRPGEPPRARSPLRPRRRVHGGRARPLGQLGRRRAHNRQGNQGASPTLPRCIGWITRAAGSGRAGRSRCRARLRGTPC